MSQLSNLVLRALTGLYKTADRAELMPKKETFVFLPNGKVLIKRMPNRHVGLPSLEDSEAVPYEPPIRYVPIEGTDMPGIHGYEITLTYRDLDSDHIPDALSEYTPEDPEAVLDELYAAIGKPENRDVRDVYRSRIRALLRLLKLRRKAMESRESQPPPS